MLQSLNYPEDYDMLSPQAQRAARERAAKEALAGHQIRWVGPLAAQTLCDVPQSRDDSLQVLVHGPATTGFFCTSPQGEEPRTNE